MAHGSRHRIKLWLHTSAFILMLCVLGCALIISFNPVMLGGAARTPMSSRVGMSMAGKGLLFLTYQVLTENVKFCKRVASTKANKILNCIETVAWCAAAGVTVYSIMQFCVGISCTLSYVMIPLCGFLVVISGFSAWISIKEHKDFKQTGVKPGDIKLETVKSEDSTKSIYRNDNNINPVRQANDDDFPRPISYTPRGTAGASPEQRGVGAPPSLPLRSQPQQQQISRQQRNRQSNEYHFPSQGQNKAQFDSNHYQQQPYTQQYQPRRQQQYQRPQYPQAQFPPYPQQQHFPYPSRR